MRGLGRGLGSLLEGSKYAKKERINEENNDSEIEQSVVSKEIIANSIVNISIDELKPSIYQPRKSFDEASIDELANSIKEHGLLEPLIVKKNNDVYEIICGERRFRACKKAAVKEIPCLVKDNIDLNGYAYALIENIQREDLNPIEIAEAFKNMIEECKMTQDELAKSVGKSRSTITNLLRLNNLQKDVKKMVIANQIDLGHAKVLLSIDEDDIQLKAALYVIKKSLNVRQTEELVKNIKLNGFEDNSDNKIKKKNIKNDSYLSELENKLTEVLSGIKAKFKVSNSGKGKLTLNYSSNEQLIRLMSLLSISVSEEDLESYKKSISSDEDNEETVIENNEEEQQEEANLDDSLSENLEEIANESDEEGQQEEANLRDSLSENLEEIANESDEEGQQEEANLDDSLSENLEEIANESDEEGKK